MLVIWANSTLKIQSCSGSKTRTCNQRLTRYPLISEGRGLYHHPFSMFRYLVSTAPPRSIGVPISRGSHGIALYETRGSPLSRNFSIRFPAESCQSTGRCSTIELSRNGNGQLILASVIIHTSIPIHQTQHLVL